MKSATRSHGVKGKNVAADRDEYQGICPSCDNLALCNFIRGSRQPVMFCEEFTIDGISATAGTNETHKTPNQENIHSEKLKGLCATCENSDGCVFPKDEAGIWHCEEYR